MLKQYFIFCWWIWFFTLLYFLRIIPYSLLYTAFIAFIFTTFTFSLDSNIHYIERIFNFFLELFVLLLIILFHFVIDKKPLLSLDDIYFNLLLFLIYFFVLYVNGKTFYEIYFIDVKKEHYNNININQYIKKYYKKDL
tara:strand:+ start:2205 stop:2618 length:414 start_codon:yes stop_codon:yes gene_type:complete